MKHSRNRSYGVAVCGVFAALLVGAGFALEQAQAAGEGSAVAVIHGTKGNEGIHGTVTFTPGADGVTVTAEIMGLKPGKHGFHIHQFGDLSAPDGTSAGGHFNPGGHPHAAPDAEKRHVGDLGNLEADAAGKATMKMVDKHIELEGANSVLGRAVVVHEKADDLSTQPTGDAGGRIGIAIIGHAQFKPL
jgi:Cu-Zn family superoxide dismutase